MMIEVWI